MSNVSGLYQDIYTINIRNFSTSDDGCYWCHLEFVTNSSCLVFPRPPQGYIAVDLSASRNCYHPDYLQQLEPRQCASPSNICQGTRASNPTSLPITSSHTSQACNSPGVAVGILSFLVVFLIALLLILLIVFLVIWIKYKKKYEREVHTSK